MNADVVEQLNEIHNNISRLANHTLTSDEDRKAAEYECQVAEQLRPQEAERITRETVRKSQRERMEYEKKQAECDKIKAECEKLKKNLGHIIRQKSIELIKKAFPEIEQEKLANKIRKLDEAARQDYAKELDTFERQIE